MTECRITVLAGDGIGPEIMEQAQKVLDVVGSAHGATFAFSDALFGGAAIDATGSPLPEDTLAMCQGADAVLLGAVGGPQWDTTDPKGVRPEQGLLGLRKALGVYANLRPVRVFDALVGSSTLKADVVRGVDMLIVRELTGGIYFGKRDRVGDMAYDTEEYHVYEVERIVRKACELARSRGTTNLCSVDKANVLESSRLWREVAHQVAAEYPEIEMYDMLVDNCAMQLVKAPKQFEVLVTSNMFGDILSDEASMLTGSLGMLASASLGDGPGLYEPSHGSAPDIAGQGIANPIATIMSAAMMLHYSFEMADAAASIDAAIEQVLAEGYRTADIMEDREELVGTSRMGDLIAERLA